MAMIDCLVSLCLQMRGAAEAIHDGDAEAFLRHGFGDDAIELGVIEFAQMAEEIRGGFAQVVRCA
jgi:hypothetical protein